MEIARDVKQIVASQLGVDLSTVTEGASFIDDLGADSLAIVELVLAIEDHFKISIPESKTESIRTVADVIAYIQTQRRAS